MIHHLSIGAHNPEQAAGVLAEIMGGKVAPFRPNPGSFYALQLDEHGSGVEVHPAGTELQPNGAVGGSFSRNGKHGYSPVHFALSVKTDPETVLAVARRAGWDCFDCNRGPFHVIEVWVENETMVEVLPPAYAQEYLDFFRPETIHAAMTSRPASAARQR